jgi:hypothetical protein
MSMSDKTLADGSRALGPPPDPLAALVEAAIRQQFVANLGTSLGPYIMG